MFDAVTEHSMSVPRFGRTYLGVLWLTSILYGMNCVLFVSSVYILLQHKRKNWLLLTWTFLLFGLAAVDGVIAFLEVFRPLTDDAIVGTPGAWDTYYTKPDILFIIHSQLYNLAITLQDLLLIWRLYVVWGNNWRVALGPLILEVSRTATAFVTTGLASKPNQNAFQPVVQKWGQATWGVELFINTAVTAAIAFKLWSLGRNTVSYRINNRAYRASMYTFVESGALSTGAAFLFFFLDITGNIGGIVGLFVSVQLASIAPLAIVVRIGLGVTHGGPRKLRDTGGQLNPVHSDRHLRPIQVNVSRIEHVEIDGDEYAMSRMDQSKASSLERS